MSGQALYEGQSHKVAAVLIAESFHALTQAVKPAENSCLTIAQCHALALAAQHLQQ